MELNLLRYPTESEIEEWETKSSKDIGKFNRISLCIFQEGL